jgi:uncharacterized protein
LPPGSGRAETIELWPLSQGEIDSAPDGFVDAVFRLDGHVTAPVGPLLENFAIGEVARQLTRAEEPVQLFHYRDRDKVEVDMVLEHASGAVIGIEVKSAESVHADDFRGLRHLARRLGDRFPAGIVLYAGEQQLSFGDRLAALPMSALWVLADSA